MREAGNQTMGNTGLENGESTRIQGILDGYLASQHGLKSSAGETSFHLDEDSLSAFAEGNLTQRESLPIVDHLVACKFCRHKTAELVRLDLALAGTLEDIERVADTSEPSKISAVLSGLLSKIFGTTDGAVFAHEDKDNPEKTEDTEEKDK